MNEEALKYLETIPDDVLKNISFSMPWQSDIVEETIDYDSAVVATKNTTVKSIQDECWDKFQLNPQINTSIRGLAGRMFGWGFEITSEVQQIQDVIDELTYDPRNRLYNFYFKYGGRALVEGELFNCLTCHTDGFIEVDFIEPGNLSDRGTGSSGIIFHPYKTLMPLFYILRPDIADSGYINLEDYTSEDVIPSVFIARYPELTEIARKHNSFTEEYTKFSKSNGLVFRQFGGYNRFIVSWDKSFITRRAVSYIRTTMEWLNYYENLKKYEIDHKKSSGSYLWIFSFEDVKAFKLWLALSDEDKRKTGMGAKLTPGSRLILPPGVKVECMNPQLTAIKEQDTDIMEMVASGLNEPADIMTGTSKGTFASVKASRGPMSDRVSDEVALLDRYLKYDFWGSIFYLKSKISDFPEYFKVRECTGFKKGKPTFGYVRRRPEHLLEITYPMSETSELETRARALLGVKHGPVAETLGVPNRLVAARLGIGSYGRNRIRKATEDELYPPLIYTADAESLQENKEGEPSQNRTSDNDTGDDKDVE